MKPVNYLLTMVVAVAVMASCNSVSYQKTKSGMLYKIIPGNGKDTLIKEGHIVKYNVEYSLNGDSVLFTTYGKAPQYVAIQPNIPPYNMMEVFPMMRRGDSGVVVLMLDTLVKQGVQLNFTPKKGDRLLTNFKILDVFILDSLARADFNKEMEKDRPRAEKEQQEQMAKMMKEQKEQKLKEELEMERSGEAAKGIAQIEAYLKAKSITAQKTGKGTFVEIKQQGAGALADSGKYVTVKYTGRTLEKDSVFDSGTYSIQLGVGEVIPGWDEGLQVFRQGGKGTLYVPGFRAYGKNHPQFKPFQAMIFDVEMLNVSDTALARPNQPMPR